MNQLPKDKKEELVRIRRIIHKNPELKYEEKKTAELVITTLDSLGFSMETGIAETGVVALYDSQIPGPTVLVRADMDALPIYEENTHDYISLVPGKMHACGHDGHTSILLGFAQDLLSHGKEFVPKGRVLLCFQPAEEGGSGADRMIASGILERYKVDSVFALHVWNHIPLGKVGVVNGTMMASVDEFKIVVKGVSGHGAMPQHTVDPIVVGAHIITALQTIVSRNTDPIEPCVVTVGSFHSGNAFNVIPESATLHGTVRTYSKSVYESVPKKMETLVRSIAEGFGAEIQFEYTRIDKPTINDPKMADLVRKAASNILGADSITEENTKTMGGEDFSAFLMERPGCYFFIGSRNEQKGFIHPHHSSYFDFDEDALPVGLSVMKEVVKTYLDSEI